MWGILIYILCYLGIFVCSSRFATKNRLRYMWVSAYLSSALYVYLLTETLSLLNNLNRTGVLIGWLIFLAAIAVFFMKGPAGKDWSRFIRHHPEKIIWHSIHKNKFFTLALFWFILITFLGAVLYAPNTFDAMTYHMTRIMHWLQNENVSYIVTNDQRLNYQLPLSEYIIMHIQLLLTKDYLANLIQWNAFITSLIAVSLIAAELHLNRKIQLLSCFVMAVTPNIVFQAQSTQNDLVVGSFLLLFVLFMLKLCKKVTFKAILFAGLSMGLALATKGTAFLYIGILGASFAVWILFNSGKEWMLNALKCSVIGIIGICMLIPVFCRNYSYYNTILPANPEKLPDSAYIVSDRTPMELVRTFVRNASLHFGTSNVQWNDSLQSWLEDFFGPKYKITRNTNAMKVPPKITFVLNEDCIGNLHHLVLFFLASAVLLFFVFYQKKYYPRKNIQKGICNFTLISFLVTIFIFTALCYSPWRARYHVPLFCMFSVSIAYCIYTFLRPSWVRAIFYVLLLWNGLYFLHNNPAHPLDASIFKLTVAKLKELKNDYFLDQTTVNRLNRLKEFLEKNNIKSIMYHNTSNQRDYPIYKILGTAIQKNGIFVKRVDSYTEDIEKYNIPYLLLVPWDTSLKVMARKNFKIIYNDNGILLFDLRVKTDNTITLPMDHSFKEYNPAIFFDGAYVFAAPDSWIKPETSLEFTLAKEPENDMLVHLTAYVTPVPGRYHYRFYYRGNLLHDFLVPGGGCFDFKITLPKKMLQKNRKIKLNLVADDIITLAQANISRDTRQLALRPVKINICYLDEAKMPILPIKNPKTEINLVQDLQSYRLMEGFSNLEKSGVWTSGNKAVLQIAIPPSMRGKQIFCRIDGHAFLHQDKKKSQIIKIQNREKLLVQKKFVFSAPASPILFTISPEMTQKDILFLDFILPEAESPKSLGINVDTRNLGYCLKILRLSGNQNELLFPSGKKITSSSSVIDLSIPAKSNFILGDGFSCQAGSGVWTDGENSYFKAKIPDSLLRKNLTGTMEFHTFQDQEFSFYWDGHKVGTWDFPKGTPHGKVHFTVPAKINTTVIPVLHIEIKNPKSPYFLNLSNDKRLLGIFLRKISLLPAKE